MFYKVLFVLFFLSIGCSNNGNKKTENQQSSNLENTSDNITHSIGEVLSPEARKLIEPCKEYTVVEGLIGEYYDISVTKAIANSQELSNATQQLRDSIRIERFTNPDLKIRLNVLHNTALRLHDLQQIPEINNKEVETEVSNLINAFTSITNKLNNAVKQERLEKELINYNKLNDSTKK